jgi:hypothetical protein
MRAIAAEIARSARYDIHAALPISKRHAYCGSGYNYLKGLVLFDDPWQARPERTYRIKQPEASSYQESQHCLTCSGN